MGDALLFGGSSGSGGLREKLISYEAYNALPPEEQNNPNIIWVITNTDHLDFSETYGSNCVIKTICWDAYCNLDELQKNDSGILWVIRDKTPEELSLLLADKNPESIYYDINGNPVLIDDFHTIDMKLNKESTNPVANMVITAMFEELRGLFDALTGNFESYEQNLYSEFIDFKQESSLNYNTFVRYVNLSNSTFMGMVNNSVEDITNKYNELKANMGGLKFSINEKGGLRITYDDEKGGTE